eukprot:TRINITY_DN2614_c0_g4_i2.p1 TRINITY_DN2614_c0_g4~~TRINITY_DN2614_c0_g4_i2.p1  ORF type:complete len:382 (+),score=65.82 TRINITY_DN2614_c0_g4_i2:55-1146(+)
MGAPAAASAAGGEKPDANQIEIEVKKEEPPQRPKLWGIEIRFLVLPFLTVQNAGAVLLMRAVRSMEGETNFSSQTAVIMQELIKGITCIAILLWSEGTISTAWEKRNEALKTSVPAILYLVQNNFQYIAAGILDVVSYTICGQTKIIWTGVLSVVILSRTLACNKWSGLVILCVGVILVNSGGKANSETQAVEITSAQRMIGVLFMVTAAGCSSLAGVYFEKILKEAKVSLWTRNLQLAAYSVCTGAVGLYFSKDREQVLTDGFFYGYTYLTWTCILMNAFGGLLVGCVIKYADAVLKDISIGASLCLSTLGSVFLFGYQLQLPVVVGAILVLYAVFIYGGTVPNPCGCLQPAEPATEPQTNK